MTGPDSPINRHVTTGPIAGFLVDDLQAATAELRSAGVEILFASEAGRRRQRLGPLPPPEGNL